VVVEGIEGSGKSTLISSLAVRLHDLGIDVVTTREPGGTALGNRLRAAFVDPESAIDPLAEAFVVNASRAQHLSEVIEPALRAGRVVLCDRFAAATLAYQGYGRGVDLETLRTLARIATNGREPDLTLLLDVDVERSRERVAARARASGVPADRLEREGASFHERVRDGYLTLARADGARWTILDGTNPPAEVSDAAFRALAAKLPV
jgi:dTMP kinase